MVREAISINFGCTHRSPSDMPATWTKIAQVTILVNDRDVAVPVYLDLKQAIKSDDDSLRFSVIAALGRLRGENHCEVVFPDGIEPSKLAAWCADLCDAESLTEAAIFSLTSRLEDEIEAIGLGRVVDILDPGVGYRRER